MSCNRRIALGVLLVVTLSGCGNSKSRKEGIDELQKIQTAVHGLHILVSAGITKAEYSQRLEDVLLKVGDLEQSATVTAPKFKRKEQEEIKEIYRHFSQSLLGYQTAREYFGQKFRAPDCEDGCFLLSQQDYDSERVIFPTLTTLLPSTVPEGLDAHSGPQYFRSDMLQALWKVAGEEGAAGKSGMDKLEQK